ncbi:unnamed protein product [Ilex paraguariensis]|uniref:Uncharacterized protein n=1 Tax=Ilex paraguariensis TaxID=185542 RepID=A0ABC8REJ0_9AQUA
MAASKVTLELLIDTKSLLLGLSSSSSQSNPRWDKNSLLNPKIFSTKAPIWLLDDIPVTKKKLHKCSKEEAAAGELGGFVKGLVTYMVADDLVVQPMSTIFCINALNKFNVKQVGALVDLGMDEIGGNARVERDKASQRKSLPCD